MAGNEVHVRVSATQSAGAGPLSIQVADAEQSASGRVGIVVIDEISGALVSAQRFEANDETAAAGLAGTIDDLALGRIVAVAIGGDAGHLLDDRARRALTRIGSVLAPAIVADTAWACIGRKGAAPGIAHEQSSATETAQIDLISRLEGPSFKRLAVDVTIGEAGLSEPGAIQLNGAPVVVATANSAAQCLVAVIDLVAATTVSTALPLVDDGGAWISVLASVVDAAEYGHVVAIGLRLDVGQAIPAAVVALASDLGAEAVAAPDGGHLWAFIGYADNPDGPPTEARSSRGSARCLAWPSAATVGDTITLVAPSSGSATGHLADFALDGASVRPDLTGDSGWAYASIDPGTGLPGWGDRIDPETQPERVEGFAEGIETLPIGSLVAVAVRASGPHGLTPRFNRVLESLGASRIHDLQAGQAYALVGRKGAAPGSVAELVGDAGAATASFSFHRSLDERIPMHDIVVYTAPTEARQVTLDGWWKRLRGHKPHDPGVTLIELDHAGTVVEAGFFDTSTSAGRNNLITRINGLTQHTPVILTGKRVDAATLTAPVVTAIESLGSTDVAQLVAPSDGGLIGRAQAKTLGLSVSEAWSENGITRMRDCLVGRPPSAAGSTIHARSTADPGASAAGIWHDRDAMAIDGGFRAGINVAVFDEGTGQRLSGTNFDTTTGAAGAKALADHLEALPHGRIVALASSGDAGVGLDERARRLCRAVGSGQVDNLRPGDRWCLVGMKGAAPGSVVEQRSDGDVLSVRWWVPNFVGPHDDRPPSRFVFIVFGVVVALGSVVSMLLYNKAERYQTRSLPAPRTGPRTRKALLVGVDYWGIGTLGLGGRGLTKIRNLERALFRLRYFKTEDIHTLTQTRANTGGSQQWTPSKTNFLTQLQWLVDGARPGDIRYLHFFGHGQRDTTKGNVSTVVTLSDDLRSKSSTYAAEMTGILSQIDPGVKLTIVMHCCFGGGMVDSSDSGRGVVLSSVSGDRPSVLMAGADVSSLIKKRLWLTYHGQPELSRPPEPTYNSMLAYVTGRLAAVRAEQQAQLDQLKAIKSQLPAKEYEARLQKAQASIGQIDNPQLQAAPSYDLDATFLGGPVWNANET